MDKVIDPKDLASLMEGSDEQRLAGFDEVLSEHKIKRLATFDKFVLGLDEGKVVRVKIEEGKIVSREEMPVALEESVQPARRLVEWILGGDFGAEESLGAFVNQLATKEAKISIAEKKIDSLLGLVPVPTEEQSKVYGDDARKLAEETFQSIGKVVEHLSAISEVAEKVANTQGMGKLSEQAAALVQPLGTVVANLKDLLGSGELGAGTKFLEQMQNRWYDCVILGKHLKSASGVK